MSRIQRIFFIIGLDISLIFSAAVLTLYFLSPYVIFSVGPIISTFVLTSGAYLLVAYGLKIFTKMNHFATLIELVTLAFGLFISFLMSSVLSFMLFSEMSLRYAFLHFLIAGSLLIGSRVAIRSFFEYRYKKRNNKSNHEPIRTLLVGAGKGGSLFIRSLKNDISKLNLVGVVDDDQNKQGFTLCGVRVIGDIKSIPYLVKKHAIDQVTIAIPSLSPEKVEEIVDLCNEANVTFNQMPYLEEFLQGNRPVQPFREINVVDLLGREEVTLDMEAITKKIKGKTVVVSGAGGSIGSEIVRQVASFQPKKLILLGHGENSIYHIHREMKEVLHETKCIPVIGDVQDRNRMDEIMQHHKPDFVFHAAAHKHVPLMEYNPHEALKNNVYGTKNIAEAAKKHNVDTFIMVSSDKAVNPTNVMGASKRIAEMIVTGLNEPGKTIFSAVRFGNVLGSRGSVVPLFQDQLQKGGPLTVTDFRMTRYFMTIPEASRLVVQSGVLAQGGEVFVLDMGSPVKILDLAKKVIKLSGFSEKEIPIVESGIRTGEKLYEELLIDGERTERKVHDKIFVGKAHSVPLPQIYRELPRWEQLSDEELREEWLAYTNHTPELKEKGVEDKKTSVSVPRLQGGYARV